MLKDLKEVYHSVGTKRVEMIIDIKLKTQI